MNPIFTPGPWEAHKTHYGEDRTWDVSNALRTVATVNDGDGNAEANAKLLAASLRLYRAVAKLTTVVDPEREEIAVGFNPTDWIAAMRECRAAMASVSAERKEA